MKIGIHTTFVAKENILFMAEWIAYYYELGVDKFYLYDNSKVEMMGGPTVLNRLNIDRFPKGVNKRGTNFGEIIPLSDDDIETIMNEIADLYPKGVINFSEWSPLDSEGRVTYDQRGAFAHLLRNHFDEVDWMINMDMDEFLITDRSIPNLLKILPSDCNILNLNLAAGFKDRFMNPFKSCLDDSTCISWWEGSVWPNKYIVRTSHKNKIIYMSIHSVRGEDMNPAYGTDDGIGAYFRHYNRWERTPLVKHRIAEFNVKLDPALLSKVESRLGNGVGSIEWRKRNINLEYTIQGYNPNVDGYIDNMNKIL